MKVDQIVATLDDLAGDRIGRALGLRAFRPARVVAVHGLPVHRVDVRDLLLEGGNVDERDDDESPVQLGRVRPPDELLQGQDGSVLRAVRTGDQGEHGSRPRAMEDGHRNVKRRVHAGRYFDRSHRLPALRRRGRSDREGAPVRPRRGTGGARKNQERRDRRAPHVSSLERMPAFSQRTRGILLLPALTQGRALRHNSPVSSKRSGGSHG